jgi:2-phosphoglycerate kinase
VKPKLILLSGATGVGTSRFSLELAKHLDIPNIQGTDSAREIIRSIIHTDLNPSLNKSTYLAGKTKNYEEKTEDVKYSEIIRAYKNQCAAVNVAIEGVVNRAIKENISLIVEGIHLIPGKLKESDLLKEYANNFIEYHLCVLDSEIHKSRFLQRQIESPERQMDKYVNNFKEIRWIHDYMLERAKKFKHITIVDNSGTIEDTLNDLLKIYSK